MLIRTFSILFVAAMALVLATTGGVYALPTKVAFINTPQCDPLFIPTNVDEIGDPFNFPPDEALTHSDLGQSPVIPCPPTNIPTLSEALVSITNATVPARDFAEVWYVADKDTSITNFDGEANDIAFFPPGQEAFRIDRLVSDPLGIHHPLIFESGVQNGIWEAGETWHFVLQDYVNALGLAPDAITSRGVGDASVDLAGFVASSGSIIAIVPEPGTCMLLLIGLAGMLVRPSKFAL